MNGEDIVHFSARQYLQEEDLWGDLSNFGKRRYTNGLDYFNDNALRKIGFGFCYVWFRAWKSSFLLKNHLTFKEGKYFEDTLFTI